VTLPLLRDRAVNENLPLAEDTEYINDKPYPRAIAIELISKYWPQHPHTSSLLRERAENDPTLWLRERAKILVAMLEKKIC
jgi:hypothetical protein